MKRRSAFALGATALLGAATGAAWFVARERRRAAAEERSRAALEALHAETAGFWRMRFPVPGGGELETASLLGRPLLLNFWATWCPPCIKEMPEIDRFRRDQQGAVEVLGLAVDNAGPVQEFLARSPVSYRIALAGFGGTQLARELGNSAGALPFTVLFDAAGRVVQRKLGETHYAELQDWARGLGKPK